MFTAPTFAKDRVQRLRPFAIVTCVSFRRCVPTWGPTTWTNTGSHVRRVCCRGFNLIVRNLLRLHSLRLDNISTFASFVVICLHCTRRLPCSASSRWSCALMSSGHLRVRTMIWVPIVAPTCASVLCSFALLCVRLPLPRFMSRWLATTMGGFDLPFFAFIAAGTINLAALSSSFVTGTLSAVYLRSASFVLVAAATLRLAGR